MVWARARVGIEEGGGHIAVPPPGKMNRLCKQALSFLLGDVEEQYLVVGVRSDEHVLLVRRYGGLGRGEVP